MKKGYSFMIIFWLFHIVVWCAEKLGYATAESFEKNADYYANSERKWYYKFLGS